VRLISFLTGSFVAVAATSIAAIASGMTWYAVIGLAVAVWVMAQVLYVGLVGIAARQTQKDTAPSQQGAKQHVKSSTETLSDTD
jgi:Mg2+/Co2+ transporter CorB